jgi:hypothetical protein
MSKAFKYALMMVEKLSWHVVPLHSWVQGKTRWGCSCGKVDCQAPGKHPIPQNGLNGSSNNPDDIRAWWAKWPFANVGVRTGAINGIVVLDIDPRSGGDDSLAQLLAVHGQLPDTTEVLTGGGGRHIYFKHPGGNVRNSAGKLGPGLDIRGDGGYVVGPGSLHQSGGDYGFEASSTPSECGFADLPGWMLEVLIQATMRKLGERDDEGRIIIPEGYRNHYMASLAGTLHKRGCSPRAILACLSAENQERCIPPVAEDELRKVVWSITSYTGGNPLEWVRFIERMPHVAQRLEQERLTHGEGCRLTYARENGQTIGSPGE